VIVMALPGERVDAPHLFAHRLADHIVAAWPRELYEPAWLRPYADKTSYVGGISRFDGRPCPVPDGSASGQVRVLVLGGASEAFGFVVDDCASWCPGTTWTKLDGAAGHWVDDPWPHICAADVVVTHAGQSCIADVALAKRPAVVIPQPRPFDEQRATAAVLRRFRLATVALDWPDVRAWPALLAHARSGEPRRWCHWQVQEAADRAAAAIESTARRCAREAAV
jgi:hypothetical protein